MRAQVYYWVLGHIGHISRTLLCVGRDSMLGGGAGYHMSWSNIWYCRYCRFVIGYWVTLVIFLLRVCRASMLGGVIIWHCRYCRFNIGCQSHLSHFPHCKFAEMVCWLSDDKLGKWV